MTGALVLAVVVSAGSQPSTPVVRAEAAPAGPVACGPLAMALALRVLERSATDQELASLADAEGSSDFLRMSEFARERGLYTAAVRLNPTQLARLREVAILQLVARPSMGAPWREHFSVYAGAAPSPGNAYIFDPISEWGWGEMPLKKVVSRWTGATLLLSTTPIDLREIAGLPSWAAYTKAAGIGVTLGPATFLLLGRLRRRRSCSLHAALPRGC